MPHKPPTKEDLELVIGFTPAQRAFFKMLTDQRVANIIATSDLLGDFDAETLYLLRLIGSPEGKHLRKFFLEARPETLEFLVSLRKKEVEDIDKAITTAVAVQRTLSIVKWMIGGIVAMLVAWLTVIEKIHDRFK